MFNYIVGTPQERFETKVIQDQHSACMIWQGAINSNGYGSFKVDGRTDNAHRWAWRLYRGPLPKGLHVLHHCDVRACVNPEHLFIGTNLDNVRDREAKGRNIVPIGSKSGNAKLSEEAVASIKSELRDGASMGRLARKHGVTNGCIWFIAKGRSWKHVPWPA